MTKPFDPTKPVQTRSGKPARIICTDAKRAYGNSTYIIALITESSGNEITISYNLSGAYSDIEEKSVDLVNITEFRWVNVYKNTSNDLNFGLIYKSKKEAEAGCKCNPYDKNNVPGYVTTIEIPWK